MDKVHVASDGSCVRNPGGPGGWGFVVVRESCGWVWEEDWGWAVRSSTPEMELMAAVAGLEFLEVRSQVILWSDAQWVVNCGNGVWRRRSEAMASLWFRFDRAVEGHEVELRWVRAHTGGLDVASVLNRRANELAEAGCVFAQGQVGW